jgi:uncharacterized protein (DUF1501 family)
MKRRSFLQKGSILTAPAFVGGIPVTAVANNALSNFINSEDDRVLVLVQLNGGNDGLATIIPRDQQDALTQVRSNIVIPESSFIDLTNTLAFHPNMGGLKQVHDDGKLNIVQGVAYPNQNRSHFRSLDIWHTASEADEFLDTGWLGRYFDSLFPGYPEGYPNGDCPDPFALTIGSVVSETCQGSGGNFSLAIVDPENISDLATPTNNDLADGCYGDQLKFLINTIEQTNAYGDSMEGAFNRGNNLSTKYNDDNALATKLKTVARLISGGLRTKVYVVSIGGFDTHANQVVEGEPTQGAHAALLKSLSDGICAFQDDLKLLGLEERVIGMTYSEFGRRIRSNFSFGTDHGTAAPLMVFGTCVNPIVIGDNPIISPDVSQNEGVAMQYDFRSVYGSILMDWFKVEEDVVKTLLYEDFQHLPILKECETSTSVNDLSEALDFRVYPNPFNNYTRVEFTSKNEWLKISVFDLIGNEIKIATSQKFSAGPHSLQIETHNLPPGSYYYRLQTKTLQKTVRLVKAN